MDLAKVEYRIKVKTPNGNIFTLDQALVDGCNLEENDGEVAARVTFTVKNEKVNNEWLHKHLYVGNYVYVHATAGSGLQEVFRGRVYDWITSAKSRTVEIIAFDMNYRYQVSEVNIYRRKNETGASLTKRLIARWRNRVIKRLDGPHTKLPVKAYDNKMTVTEIIQDCIKESKEKGDKEYVIRCIEGEIAVVQEGTNTTVYVLSEKDYLEELTDHHSIKNLVTRVRIYRTNDKDDKARLAKTIDGSTQYGVLQRLVYTDGKSLSEATKEAKQILKEEGKVEKTRQLNHPDVPFIKKGDTVMVHGGTVGSAKNPAKLIVKSINHDIKNLSMTIVFK